MELLLAVLIKVMETIAVFLTNESLSHFKKQRKKPPLRRKRNKGGKPKIK